jgi:hypothetical protein
VNVAGKPNTRAATPWTTAALAMVASADEAMDVVRFRSTARPEADGGPVTSGATLAIAAACMPRRRAVRHTPHWAADACLWAPVMWLRCWAGCVVWAACTPGATRPQCGRSPSRAGGDVRRGAARDRPSGDASWCLAWACCARIHR